MLPAMSIQLSPSLERRIIGQRTRDALAAKRAQGVKLGRPSTLPESVVERIMAARNAGEGWSAIARSPVER
jgi:DNA invertase Pin-like site-specific DNA recombinase